MAHFWTKQIEAQVDIDADRQAVWGVLTDLRRYPEWNPFIPKASGDLVAGRKLSMRIHVPGGMRMHLWPKLLTVSQPAELRWLGHALIPGLFDGEHRFLLDQLQPQKTRFLQIEVFRGVLVPLMGTYIAAGALRGFEAMNKALKKRVETSSGA